MNRSFLDSRSCRRTICEYDINSDIDRLKPSELLGGATQNSTNCLLKDTKSNNRNSVRSSAFSIENILCSKDSVQFESAPKNDTNLINTQNTSLDKRK